MRRKSKAHQLILVLAVIVIGQTCVAAAQAQQEISAQLSRAQSFYRANQFEESLILLTELEKRIGTDPQKKPDLLTIKLYMGLAHLGLNQTDQAKSKFTEVCKLDSKYTLNPEEYPPNAVALFNDVMSMCAPPPAPVNVPANLTITDSTFQRGKELYEKGEFGDALKYFNVVLALDNTHALAREYSELAQQRLALIAERGYLEWSISFDGRQFDKAAATYLRIRSDQKLGAAQLASQIETQYQKALTSLVNAWKAACAARELQKLDAIRNEALSIAPGLPFSREATAQMQPCSSPTTANIPNSAAPTTIPNPAPGPTTFANGPAPSPRAPAPRAPSPRAASSPTPAPKASPSPAPAPKVAAPPAASSPAPKPAPAPQPAPAQPAQPAPAQPAQPAQPAAVPRALAPGECINGDPMLAMSRLRVRINPEIEPALRRYVGRGIVVSINIDDKGNVTVKDVAKANPRIADALKTAVGQWKFNPTVIDNQVHCVNTDLPITLIQP